MHFNGQIKDRLVARRRALLDRYLAELVRADEELDASDVEPVGHAADQYDAHLLLQLGEADARALGEVAAAIKRFDAGTYGRCVTCFREIDAKRLDALPAVALCFACAAHAEAHDTQRLH
jgi:DnaK suppressor protein